MEHNYSISNLKKLVDGGIFLDDATGRQYFTGYQYKTLYDWDQYFETIVQLYLGYGTQMAINGVLVFLERQREDGFIVRLNQVTDPGCDSVEHAKPFLAQIVLMILKQDGNISWLTEKYYVRLEKYLAYWMTQQDRNKNGLPSWNSAPHTGMDNQHERAGWWNECFCEGADLASYLYRDFTAMALISRYLGKGEKERYYRECAERIKEAIHTKMWDESDGFFYDRDERTGEKICCKTIAGFMPLWAGICTDSQAKRLIETHLLNEEEFWRPFPVSVMAATEKKYSEKQFRDDLGCNWRANTWIPTNYIVLEILKKYGYTEKAAELADKTEKVISKEGLREYYTSETMQGCGLNPFWGWSVLGCFMQDFLKRDFPFTELSL